MKIQKLSSLILAFALLLGVGGCGGNKEAASSEQQVSSGNVSAEKITAPTDQTADGIAFSKDWECDENNYGAPNEGTKEHWEEFKVRRDAGAPTDELLSILSEVVADDEQFVPGYLEYARYYLLHYNETGDPTSPSNAMNILTRGAAKTGDPLFNKLKESLGWNELNETIKQAEEALKQRDRAAAFERINSLPEEYFNILEANRIISILNDFDDTYYYQIMGHTLGQQYIVHFQIDGTYERVRMNEDGIHDTGTWESSALEDWDIRFADIPFQGSGGSYFCVEYDSNYNKYEYQLNISKDGAAREQFAYIAGLGNQTNDEPLSDMMAMLTGNKWQADEGWYYTFRTDGTGTVSMIDGGYSYGVTYFEHPEKENAVIIVSSDMPEEYTWIFDLTKGTFQQESYGYDVTTDTVSVYYKDVSVYNG